MKDAANGALRQVWTWDSGLEQVSEWEFLSTDEDGYAARDLRSGVVARGRRSGKSFVWAFKTKAPTPFGTQTVRVQTTYSTLSATMAESVTKTTLMGVVPVSSAETLYSHEI